MAMNALLNRISKCAAIFVIVAVAAASAMTVPGRVTLFTFTAPESVSTATDAVVDVGSTVTVRCRVEYNIGNSTKIRTPTVRLRKTFGNGTWLIANNEEIEDQFAQLGRVSGSPIDNQPNGIDVYEWTIASVQLGDTGNYTCHVQSTNMSSSLSVSLNVSAEPTQLNLYINGEMQSQSTYPAVNKKVLSVGQTYRLLCVVSGGNPFPNVTLTNGATLLTPDTVTRTTNRTNNVDAVASVTRSVSVGVNWTMTNQNVGNAITCKAGVKNLNATSNSFIALADNALPNFNCPDQFDYDGKQSVLTLQCKIASADLSAYYISWRNGTTNVTVQGTKNVDVQASGDSRYSLRVGAPQGSDIWWTMTLTINNANKMTDLNKITFHYVAVGSRGQAIHDVTVRPTFTGTGPISGASWTVSSVGCLALLISITMATLFSRI